VSYPDQMVKAIRDSRGLVLILTPCGNESRNVLQEVITAHVEWKLIVPLIVRGTRPSDGLSYITCAPTNTSIGPGRRR
jgi:hypothetical protein